MLNTLYHFIPGEHFPLSYAEVQAHNFGRHLKLGGAIFVDSKWSFKDVYKKYQYMGGAKRLAVVVGYVKMQTGAGAGQGDYVKQLTSAVVSLIKNLGVFAGSLTTGVRRDDQDILELKYLSNKVVRHVFSIDEVSLAIDINGLNTLQDIFAKLYGIKKLSEINHKFLNINFYGDRNGVDLWRPAHNLAEQISYRQILEKLKESGIKAKLLGDLNRLEKNTATSQKVLRNKGLELNIVLDTHNKVAVISVTVAVQDYQLWGRIEYDRPVRNMKVGMIPIKLALIMLNLAKINQGKGFWDPMAGLGTIVMAGILKGAYSYGSDIDHRMVEAMRKNIGWLYETGMVNKPLYRVFQFDVRKRPRTNRLLASIIKSGRFDAVVTEGYLGPRRFKPFKSKKHASFWAKRVSMLNKQFLKNITSAVRIDGRVVFCMPIFKYEKHANNGGKRFGYLDVKPEINKNRFKIIKFDSGDLVWDHPRSIVKRRIYVLERIK